MKTSEWVLGAAVLGTVAGLVSACGETPARATNPPGPVIPIGDPIYAGAEDWTRVEVQISDGWMVTCLVWAGSKAGGPSCDWDHPKRSG